MAAKNFPIDAPAGIKSSAVLVSLMESDCRDLLARYTEAAGAGEVEEALAIRDLSARLAEALEAAQKHFKEAQLATYDTLAEKGAARLESYKRRAEQAAHDLEQLPTRTREMAV